MATVLSIILGTMTMTSRKKERGLVGYAVLLGTICNLVLSVIALVGMKTRRERLGLLHQSAVFVVVAGNCVIDVMLLRWVFYQL
jgi:hypothetical protein